MYGPELCLEIAKCLDWYHGVRQELSPDLVSIGYAVAAPDWYFEEQRRDDRIFARAASILERFAGEPRPKFSGFWSLQCRGKDIPVSYSQQDGGEAWLPALQPQVSLEIIPDAKALALLQCT